MGYPLNEFGDTEVLLYKNTNGEYELCNDPFQATHKATVINLQYHVKPECEHPFLKVRDDFHMGKVCGICRAKLRAVEYRAIEGDD